MSNTDPPVATRGLVIEWPRIVLPIATLALGVLVWDLVVRIKDIPPFILQQGQNCVTALNMVGLRRAGCSLEAIQALRQCFRIFFREGRSQSAAIERIENDLGTFIDARSRT